MTQSPSTVDDHTDNEDYCWPDPGPICTHSSTKGNSIDDHPYTRINDVSRMSNYPNGTLISRIFFPRCEEDVLCILRAAHYAKKCVGIRGTKHSMGGHSIASKSGWEIDTKFLRHIKYDADEPDIVRCGPGCQWSDVIKVLNAYGKSPRTMQSYCSFSVGGTLSVNAHGVTTDYCFAESVVEMRMASVSAKGQVKIVNCKPSNTEKKSPSEELFSLVLGGYGLFGVITEVVLKVESNVKLELDSMQLQLSVSTSDANSSEFLRVYDNCRNATKRSYNEDALGTSLGKVEIKLARLNTITLDKASLYVFRTSAPSHTISDLPASPRELSDASRLLYKWALPLLKERRYAKEENTGKAMDWSKSDSLTRNQLLFESALPLSKLYEPLLKKDDTFILQEFFVPRNKVNDWFEAARPIYKEIEEQQHVHGQDLILLNTTIRYVENDDVTFLSYSRVPEGVLAFVLYFRIKRDQGVEGRLGDFHNRFANATVSLGGTFYLPYRRCYSAELLKAAYPMIEDFAKKKEQFDPDCLFSNLWFEHYVLPLCSESYKMKWSTKCELEEACNPSVGIDHRMYENILPKTHAAKTKHEFLEWLPRMGNPLILRRTNSYRSLLRSKLLQDQFRDQFLVQIFNLADPDEVMRVMGRAAWDPLNHDDIHIYKFIYNHFHGESGQHGLDLPKLLPQYWRGIQQLRQQKEELARQTLNILMRLGKIGHINDYVCIGDHGKTVKIFARKMPMNGKIWVVHSSEDVVDKHIKSAKSEKKVPSLATVLERGSLDSVAHDEILFDYCLDTAREKFARIPTDTVDLVTMNQGLHHIPLENLFGFLVEVKRILRPGGIFIIREHDLQMRPNNSSTTLMCNGQAPYPMLDIAHSIFNAVTGVPAVAEAEEIRAFRPITEWRAILAKVGFIDTMVSEVEDGDPTWDEMLAFCLPSASTNHGMISTPNKTKSLGSVTPFDVDDPPIFSLIRSVLGQVPASTATTAEMVLTLIQRYLPLVRQHLRSDVLNEIPNLLKELRMVDTIVGMVTRQVTTLIEMKLVATIDQMAKVAEGALSLLSQSEVRKFYNFKNLVHTPEVFLLLPYLERKVKIEGDGCNEAEKLLVTFVASHFPLLLFENEKKEDCKSEDSCCPEFTNRNNDVTSSEVTEVEVKAVIERLAESIPGLLDPDILLVQSGFTLTQQTSLIAKFGSNDVSSFSRSIAGFLDRQTFEDMKTKLQMVEERKELPTRDRLFSSSESHPWYLVMKTFMKSPRVVLEHRAIFGLKMIGLGEVETLYKAAKKEQVRAPSTEHLQFDSEVVSYLRSLDRSLEALGNKWTNDIVERKITFGGSAEMTLFDVAEVLSARFGYKSITSRKVDVTRELQNLHALIHAKIANPEYDFHIPDNAQVGWLPIDQDMLIQIRNRGSTKRETGDKIRRSLVKGATLGLAGTNQLIIKYRRIVRDDVNNRVRNGLNPVPDSVVQNTLRTGLVENIDAVCGSLGTFLESKDLIQKDLHPSDGHYTFFKLNEWMQVEILEELVKSLSHTPWYQFPFMTFLGTYFDVFRQQCKIVQRKYGTLTAYTSEAFFVDLIPGLVMSFLFGQLQLLAVPLKMTAPPDGYAGLDQTKFLEEVVVHVQLPGLTNVLGFFKAEVDGSILKARLLPGNFVVIATLPFKAMGDVLISVAKRFPAARVFQISNQKEVQVRISRTCSDKIDRVDAGRHDRDLERIMTLPRVERLMEYQFPNTFGSGEPDSSNGATGVKPMKKHYCFQVHCLSLLDVIRTCSLVPALQVEQIYDFWN